MAGKQFQFYLDIICNLDKFYMVLIKFAYLPPLNCTRDRILSLVSVQGTNEGQKYGNNKQTRENMTPKTAYFTLI